MIDVLLPYYGDPDLLRRAVVSVLGQSTDAWRLLVVDDHSPHPEVGTWVAALGDSRITYSRNDQNLGVNGNFRRCLEHATAPIVTFMGCDDEMGADHLRTIADAWHRHPGAGLVQPRVRVVDADGAAARGTADRIKSRIDPVGSTETVLRGEDLARRLMIGNWLYFPAIAWRRELLERHPFRSDMETTLDLALVLDLVLAGESAVLLPEETFSYRRHARSASSLTARSAERFVEELRLFDEYAERFEAHGWHRAAAMARLHPTSRAHTLSTAVGALAGRDTRLAGRLTALALSRGH